MKNQQSKIKHVLLMYRASTGTVLVTRKGLEIQAFLQCLGKVWKTEQIPGKRMNFLGLTCYEKHSLVPTIKINVEI